MSILRDKIRKMLEGKKFSVTAFGSNYSVIVKTGVYVADQSVCIDLMLDDGEPFCTLTSCLPHITLEDKEILVKTWSENEETAEWALKSGLFRDTGKRASTGFVLAQIWEVIVPFHSVSTWVCANKKCDVPYLVHITYQDIANSGVPMCPHCERPLAFLKEEWKEDL